MAVAVQVEQRLRQGSRLNDITGCIEWRRARDTRGYGLVRIDSRLEKAHRVAWRLVKGSIPEGMQLDHICHTRHCLNVQHLRLVTPKQNSENVLGAQSNTSSGYLGVHADRQRGGWRAQVRHNGKLHDGGRFSDPEAAAVAAASLRRQLFTHHNDGETFLRGGGYEALDEAKEGVKWS